VIRICCVCRAEKRITYLLCGQYLQREFTSVPCAYQGTMKEGREKHGILTQRGGGRKSGFHVEWKGVTKFWTQGIAAKNNLPENKTHEKKNQRLFYPFETCSGPRNRIVDGEGHPVPAWSRTNQAANQTMMGRGFGSPENCILHYCETLGVSVHPRHKMNKRS